MSIMEPRIIALVHRVLARAAFLAFMLGDASRVLAEPLVVLVPCERIPAAVATLDLKSPIDSYGIAADGSVAVAATASPGEDERSDLWFARGGEEPRAIKLAGRVLGLAVARDGHRAYAVVRVTDRRGAVKRVELVTLDLKTARAISGATLPATARGLAIAADGTTLLVASRDEIRTFQLPDLASGRMYRALGENVGVAPVAGSSTVLIAQPSRLVIADLAGTHGRDGLVLSHETAAPAALTGLVSSTTDGGAIVLSDGGAAWCVRLEGPPLPPPPPEVPAEPPQSQPVPAEVPLPEPEIAPPSPPPPAPAPPVVPTAPHIPAVAGAVSGTIEVDGRVEYVDPLHNLAVVRYDPKQLGNTPVRAVQLADRLPETVVIIVTGANIDEALWRRARDWFLPQR